MIVALFKGDFGYDLLYTLHILAIVIGFGTTFAYPVYARRARQLPPNEGYAITHTSIEVGKILTTYVIWAAGLFGIILVGVSDAWEFSQTWVSIAFVLFFFGVLFSWFVHSQNLKKMDELQARLVAGDAKPNPGGGPPPEVAELQARGKRAGMTGGILHLVFLLLVIDMIWKPFL